jgi:hypothetical protein
MTAQEREEYLQFLKEFRKNLTKESARAFLVEIGIYTEDGQLTEPYKNLYIPDPEDEPVVANG